MDAELVRLLSEADRALGRLDGATSVLPNPDLFVAMYVRQEAVYSSQIEGTQSTLEDVLDFEAEGKAREHSHDVEEVVNYVRAMNYGLKRLPGLPLSLRLIKEIHAELMHEVRGQAKTPGEFRKTQNWIGPHGCLLKDAEFVPPPVAEMKTSLANLERFLHDTTSLPPLMHCGVAHAQFETIHPFLDGNGRVGRLLIAFLLCQRQILSQPLLYLSHFLKAHRNTYYDKLTEVRVSGNWEGWLKFFLTGVSTVSEEAASTARSILNLQEEHRRLIRRKVSSATNAMVLLDFMFRAPVFTIRMAERDLGCAYVTARNLVEDFEKIGLVREVTGGQRNRRYHYDPYLKLFKEPSHSASHCSHFKTAKQGAGIRSLFQNS